MTLAMVNHLVGGLGLFLLGMWLMTDGLKLAAGEVLQSILQRGTRTPLRAFFSGFLITAIVQSSSATTVATVGFVNAGLMALYQAVWVVIGANAGTTMTSWLVAIVGIKVDVGAFALLLVGVGMIGRLLAGSSLRRAGLGQAIAGFGAFFLGIGTLQTAFADITPYLHFLPVGENGILAMLAFTALGILLTVLTQSSSAAMAITLTASVTGSIPLSLAAATVIGTNIGTTSTTLFAAINSTPAARRVAVAHVTFNMVAALLAFALLPFLLWTSQGAANLIDGGMAMATVLAVFHTLFNFSGALAIWPLRDRFINWLSARFISPVDDMGRPAFLDDTLLEVPTIALRGLAMEMSHLIPNGFALVRRCIASSGTKAAAECIAAQGSMLRLSREVRQFIAQLGSNRLPDDIAQALPSLIRATQHLDEALVASHTLINRPNTEPTSHPSAAKLRDAALDCLDTGRPGEISLHDPDLLDSRASRLEAAYENEKADLLNAAASGRMSVNAMEQRLDRAQILRRCGILAIKVQRRLVSVGPLLELSVEQTHGVSGVDERRRQMPSV